MTEITYKITQAFIFAAGRGERMRPITDTIPKPLVKINNKSIIDYTIEKLDKIPEIKTIIINGFYLSEKIEEHIKNLNNPKIIFSKENEKLETGGGLAFAIKNLKGKINLDEPLLTINGDILWQEKDSKETPKKDLEKNNDIRKICANFNPKKHDILLGLKKKNEFLGYEGSGDFNLDKNNATLFKREKEENEYVFTGISVVNPKILLNVTEKCFSMSYFYKSTINQDGILNKVSGIELDGKYFHIGDIAAIRNTENSSIQ